LTQAEVEGVCRSHLDTLNISDPPELIELVYDRPWSMQTTSTA